jgi:hypothetical protein
MLLFETGTGDQTIPNFNAPSEWELKTIWDCPSGVETISVQIDNPDGTPDLDQDLTSVNDFDSTGTNTEQEHKAGTFGLSVMTDCNWTITARATSPSPRPPSTG